MEKLWKSIRLQVSHSTQEHAHLAVDGDARLHGADERQLPPCGAPDDGGGQRVRRAPLDGRRQLQHFRLVVARRRQAVRDLQTSSGGHRRGERQETNRRPPPVASPQPGDAGQCATRRRGMRPLV